MTEYHLWLSRDTPLVNVNPRHAIALAHTDIKTGDYVTFGFYSLNEAEEYFQSHLDCINRYRASFGDQLDTEDWQLENHNL